MNDSDLNFVTQGYEGVLEVLLHSVESVKKYYPESTFYIYDGGLESQSAERLSSFSNTVLIDWKEQATPDTDLFDDFRYNFDSFIRKAMRRDIIDRLIDYDCRGWHKRKDFLHTQKIRTIIDICDRINRNLIWIDGDVVVLQRFDEIFQEDFDVGATLRSQMERKKRRQREPEKSLLINSGVIFFPTSSKKIQDFAKKWLATKNDMSLHYLNEQASLSKLFLQADEQIFDGYYNVAGLDIDDTECRVKNLPCLKYNYYWHQYGIYPNITKLVHFKGWSGDDIERELLDDIQNDNVDQFIA